LAALRCAAPPSVPRPSPFSVAQTFEAPLLHFERMLAEVGGSLLRVPSPAALPAAVAALPRVATSSQVASLVPEVHPGHVSLQNVEDAHALAEVDVAIVRGAFCVAENGAVWVEGEAFGPRRALLFLCQHLVLVVDSGLVVHTLHEAYARLSFVGPSFGCFVAGPSKTADIEQALVIGAHGPRSATVCLVA
jgi:L-lactate dehydrogenase complex protein LldG